MSKKNVEKRYLCVKEFFLDQYDADENLLNKPLKISENSVWKINTVDDNIIAGNSCVHLDRVWKTKRAKTEPWIEIEKKMLRKYFRVIKEKIKDAEK